MKALIFDMDGTLVDSTYLDFLAWQEVFQRYEVSFSYPEYISLMGVKSVEIFARYVNVSEQETSIALAFKMRRFKEIASERGIQLIDGVRDFILKARQDSWKIALASGARREKVNFLLEQTGILSLFDCMVTAEDVTYSKPDPEVFLKTIEKLGVSKENTIIFEDSECGILACKRAGLTCVALTTTTDPSKLQGADAMISCYHHLDPATLLA